MGGRSLKYNAAVLTITGFVVKAIGFVYRIFIANSIGSEGIGLYQLVYPVYSLLVLVLSAGISVSVSRFVAEESSRGREKSGMKIASISAGVILVVGVAVSIILIFNMNLLILGFSGDERARRSLEWMLYLIPPIAAASAYKGYFYGKQQMMPNAVGQIIEQLVKLAFVVLMIGMFKGKGIEGMCLLATLGLLIGELANVTVVAIAFVFHKSKHASQYGAADNTGVIVKKLVKTAVPISANRLILSAIGTLESFLIPQRLIIFGLTFQQSLQELGRLSGMASPLVFFPSMLPMALATALVPAIASAVSSRQYNVANRQISQSIKLTIVMGLVFTSFFASCSHEVAEVVFPRQNVGGILYMLSFTGVFLYLQHTMLGILNGLARESAILLNTLAGSVVRLAIIWFCIPLWGIDAYLISVIVGSMVSIALNFKEICKITGMSIDVGEWIVKPLTATLIGTVLGIILKQLPSLLSIGGRYGMLFSSGIFLLVLCAVFAISGIIKKEDIKRWAGKGNASLYDFL